MISGLCLADTDASTTNGTQLNVATCSGSTQQHWILPATTVAWAPEDVTATAGPGSATVSWEPASGGGNTITGYTVTSSVGQTATAGPDSTSATVTGLTAGTSYTFTVTADTADPVAETASAATTAITPGNETSYTYDATGNLTSSETDGTTTTNTYNADEELTSSVTGTTTTSYTYNAADEMTGADTTAGNFAYTYDSEDDLADTDLDGTVLSDTIWDLNNPLPEAAEDTTASETVTDEYDWNPDGTLNSESEGGATGTRTTYGAVTDWEGSLTGLVNSSGTQVSTTNYSAYGTASTTSTVTSKLGSYTPSPCVRPRPVGGLFPGGPGHRGQESAGPPAGSARRPHRRPAQAEGPPREAGWRPIQRGLGTGRPPAQGDRSAPGLHPVASSHPMQLALVVLIAEKQPVAPRLGNAFVPYTVLAASGLSEVMHSAGR